MMEVEDDKAPDTGQEEGKVNKNGEIDDKQNEAMDSCYVSEAAMLIKDSKVRNKCAIQTNI